MDEHEANLRDALFGYMCERSEPHTYLREDDPARIERMIDNLMHKVDWVVSDYNAGPHEGSYYAKAE